MTTPAATEKPPIPKLELIPVTVVVARVDFPGFYCLGGTEWTDSEGKLHRTLRGKKGVYFPSGSTDIEVTPDELAALRRDEAMVVPVIDKETGKETGKRKAMPISVIEYSPGEMALRLAARAERAAQEAEQAAEAAIIEAQAKSELAKRLTVSAEAAVAAAEKLKGKAQKVG